MRRSPLLILLLSILIGFAASGAPRRPGAMMADARKALALSDYRKAIIIADSVERMSTNALTRIEACDIITRCARATGQFATCDRYFRQAISLSDSIDAAGLKSDNGANLRFNYSQFLLDTGRYDECLSMLSQSAGFARGSEERLRVDGLRASALFKNGFSRQAIALLDSVIDSASDSPSLAILLQNRGFIHRAEGNHHHAYSDLSLAASMLKGKDRAIALSNEALALSSLGNDKEALKVIDEALSQLLRISGEKDADYIIALRKKGEIELAAGMKRQGASTMREFFNKERDRLISILPSLSPQARLDYWTKEKPLLSKCFLAGDEDAELMFDVALTRRQTSLLGISGNEDAAVRLKAGSREVRSQLKPDEAAVAFVAYDDPDGTTGYAAAILPARGETRFIHLFDSDLTDKAGTVGALSLTDALTGEDPDAKNALYSDLLLGELVWRPVIENLPSSVRTIHFAPEGIFHLWAIENMPFDGRQNYSIIRHFSLLPPDGTADTGKEALVAGGLNYDAFPESHSDLPASADNEAFRQLRSRLADPSTTIFTYLPGTAKEAKKVSDKLGETTLLSSLSEEDFKHSAQRLGQLHLATHAYALDCGINANNKVETDSTGVDLSLIRSGIALSGANVMGNVNGREDGILSAREICDLDLSGVDMAVLSACQTAKGLISDESASGLIRALKNAGARTIVATLWEVDDRAASIFMEAFYSALAEGKDRSEAFEYAKKSVAGYRQFIPKRKFSPAAMASRTTSGFIESTPFASPWYWASFIIIDP